MPLYQFTGADGRDYFPPGIGHVEPGDVRDLTIPPDSWWTPAGAPTATEGAPDAPAAPSSPAQEA